MKNTTLHIIGLLFFLVSISCSEKIPNAIESETDACIFPDYKNVTIPLNIAPLNFRLENPHSEAFVILKTSKTKLNIKERNGQFSFSSSDWEKLLREANGEHIDVTLYAKEKQWIIYPSFSLFIAPEPIDAYLAYRLIEPGYELWNQMGIYQRELSSYEQTPIMENKFSNYNCMNCHSFCNQNPNKMLFHMRSKHSGTYLIDGENINKLNTKTDQTISPLVYPSWHPSGKYVAFSVNTIQQSFHTNDKNQIEVFDQESDVVIYDVEHHEVFSTSLIKSKEDFETFPTFSPDGKSLYFCSAKAQEMPKDFDKVKYNLCRISFDLENRSFGSRVDTLYNAEDEGKSVSFPRVSPNGKYLLFTVSRYGNFSIWHKDADLYMLDIDRGSYAPLDNVNSSETESYHSWSSNSHWIAFSSRRIDGLYTRPYFSYIDEKGNATKPFLLPQEDTHFYYRSMKSYNIPEFITGKVPSQMQRISKIAKESQGTDVHFKH